MNAIKRAIRLAIQSGLPLPHAYDPVEKVPSFRLLGAYISFLMAASSVVALHFVPSILPATAVSIGFYCLCMVFYMLKKLQQAKISLKEQEISLEGVDKS